MMFPKSERAGIIDIGSNSVRLVIYDVLGASILQTFNEKVMAGLGEGLVKRGTLSPSGREAAMNALSRYRAILRALNLRNYTAVATAAVREATDGPEFVRKAGRVLGVEASFHLPKGVMGDLGGSSLEFQHIGAGKAKGESLLLGPLSLAEYADDLRELRKKVRAELKASKVLPGAAGRFFAVGGAWRSFARLNMEVENYPLHVLHGYQMTEGQVARTAKLCLDSVSHPGARNMIEKVDRRRAKHLPIAAIILEELLDVSPLEGVTISSAGLREGVLRDLTGAAVTDPLPPLASIETPMTSGRRCMNLSARPLHRSRTCWDHPQPMRASRRRHA